MLKALGTLSEIDQASGVPLAGIIEVDLKRGGIFFRIRGAIDRNLDGAAARAYLGSGLVSHVGPAIAEEIVGAFADETMDVLLWAPERLVGLRGLTAPIMVVKSDGSLMSLDSARQRPIETILSGPAASVAGARICP